MIRKIFVPLAFAAGLLTAGTAAEARDGCGPGLHRGYYGWCRPNVVYGPFVYAPAYRGYGYRRWGGGPRWHYAYHYSWHRRFAWHGGGRRWGGFRHGGWHRRW